MRGTLTASLIGALLLGAADARGQAPDVPSLQVSPAIAARMHWIQQRMTSGRVVGTSGVSVPKTYVQLPGRRTGRRETLTLEIDGGICNMVYESVEPHDRLKIAMVESNELSIKRERPDDHYTLEFLQRPDQPLELTVTREDHARSWQAPGLWQMYLAEPKLVRDHLIPLLELLRSSWQLASTGAEIEAELLHGSRALARPKTDRRRWQQLVDALGSPKFSERENAERELHGAGQAVVPFLQGLDRTRLDAEQAYRVRTLVETLSVDDEDTVERLAGWLADDDNVWLLLLARDEPAVRTAAAAQLARLRGEPIEFDPRAPAEQRARQLEQLRASLEAARQPAE